MGMLLTDQWSFTLAGVFAVIHMLSHVFRKYCKSTGWIRHEYMGHCTDESAVLYDGTSAHTLNYAARRFKKLGVGYRYHHILGFVLGIIVYLLNENIVFLRFTAVYSGIYLSLARVYILTVAEAEFLAFCCETFKCCVAVLPEYTAFGVSVESSEASARTETSMKLAGDRSYRTAHLR